MIGTLVGLLRIGLRTRNPLGLALVFSTVGVALSAVGHDVFRRIEFQLLLHALAALAVMDARDAAAARAAAGPGGARRGQVAA
jgi:hypothetical protein